MLEQLAGLGVPEPHQVADPQQRGARAGQRRLHLARTLEAGQVQARAAPTGVGSRSLPAGPEATRPPPCTVATWRDGRRTTGSAEERRRRRLERLVVVEQAGHQQPGPRGHLGHDRVRRGGLDRAGAAGVPELQLGHGGQRLGDLAAAYVELGDGSRLEPAYDQRPGPLASGTSSGTPATWPS